MDTNKCKKSLQSGRIDYIDGIRGISSILVIFCHLACVFIPGLYFVENIRNGFERLWINSPLNVLTNGNTPVQCFFVMSGFLIARKMYQPSKKMNSPLREYRKLLRVVIPGILFAFVLMVSGLMFHIKAANHNSIMSFVNDYNNFNPTFLNVVKDIFFSTFVDKSIYVGPFWTIKYEFLGALLITAISYYAAANKHSKSFYILFGIGLLFINPYLVSFVIGAFVFDCLYKENDETLLGKAVGFLLSKKALVIVLFVIGLYLLCVNNYLSKIWKPFKLLQILKFTPEIVAAMGVGTCLLCIEKTKVIKKFLSIRPLKFLGSISAYTYAFHWPIILSLGCGMYLLLENLLPYYYCVLIISLSVIIVTIILSYLFTKLLPKILVFEKKIGEKVAGRFKKNNSQGDNSI